MATTTKPKYLLDTTIFIDFLRGANWPYASAAHTYILKVYNGVIEAGVSPITDFELWMGTKNAADQKRHRILLARFRRFSFNTTIARRAGELYKPLKGQISIPDVILVATAEFYKCTILTRNNKHFNIFNALVPNQTY